MSDHHINAAFHPQSIAVAGASENSFSMGYNFLYHLKTYGFKGKIYPVTPKFSEVLGYKAYSNLKDVPEPVDYVICCLPAIKVPDLLRECTEKNVKVVHLFTGRFSETGKADAAQLEVEISRLSRTLGIRLIGPNCMGIYHPGEGLAFGYDFPIESGKMALVFQSGGACSEFIYYAALRGIRFSKVISYGNAMDIDESDLLEYLADDEETQFIACYIEGIKDGKKFVRALRRATAIKPVIILKAGRGDAGSRSAASHTASMAGSLKVWESAVRQTGVVPAQSIEDMIDLAVSFYFLPPVKEGRVGIVGGGGGQSVLSADEWEEAGFQVVPLTQEINERIEHTLPELWWGWLSNPVDISILPQEAFGVNLNDEIMKMMALGDDFDIVVANFSIGAPRTKFELARHLRNYTKNIVDLDRIKKNPIVAVLNTGVLSPSDFLDEKLKCLSESKATLVAAGIPVYSSPGRAAGSVGRLIKYYRFQKKSGVRELF